MRIFAYCRVSTIEQTTDNQVQAIRARGYDVQDDRVIAETISGSVHAEKRPEFKALLEHKLEKGDQLIVLKLDRLGRDNIDVQKTIEALMAKGVGVRCLDLPNVDLTSAEGKMILQIFGAFAQFERDRIRERTCEGLERAKASGKVLGRPEAKSTTKRVLAAKASGLSQSKVAAKLGLGIATVKRHWNKST